MTNLDNMLNQIQGYMLNDIEQNLTQQTQDQIYEQMIHLQQAREKVFELLPVPTTLSERLQHSLALMIKRSEIAQRFARREVALDQSGLEAGEKAQRLISLRNQRDECLNELPVLPALSLEEQERLLQELMRQAVNQYVEQSLEQMQLNFHFEVA